MALSRSRAILAALILAFGSLAATRTGDAAQPRGSNILVQPHGPPTNVLVRANLTIDMVEPASPSEGQPVRVNYRLRGYVATRGLLFGSAQGRALTNSAGQAEIPIVLAPDQVVTGTMWLRATHAGPATIRLAYVDRRNCRSRPDGHGRWMTICDTIVIAQSEQDLQIAAAPEDNDWDGLDDALEDRLLARYRPFYRFSAGESYRPTDPLWHIRHSELQLDDDEFAPAIVSNHDLAINPNSIFVSSSAAGSSRLLPNTCNAPYWLDPDDNYLTGLHDGDGFDWPEIAARGNVGLYGHVRPATGQPNLIQIEYWQFYAYNYANVTHALDHEGDWEVVAVMVDRADPNRLVEVVHYVHGNPIGFHSFSANAGSAASTLYGSNASEADSDLDLSEPTGLARAQDSVLTLVCGDVPNECTHPVVWVELGTHASWPQAGWGWSWAPDHDGNGVAYLAATPPNLGEPNAPRPATQGADIIMNYAGHWGADSLSIPEHPTSPPRGPALHRLWAWAPGKTPPDSCLE